MRKRNICTSKSHQQTELTFITRQLDNWNTTIYTTFSLSLSYISPSIVFIFLLVRPIIFAERDRFEPESSNRLSDFSPVSDPKMPRGTLEVLLVGAKGLENSDFLCNMDPYVVLTCRTQEQKSSVASGKGTEPEWNETFVFNLSDGVSKLDVKILDSDAGSEDDLVGVASIPLEPLFMEGSVPPTSYNVIKEQEYCGEIRLGLTFTPDPEASDRGYAEEEYGGWKESS